MYEKGISVCITAYRAKNFIKECLDSVMNQTWFKENSNWEVIVGIDGCARTLHYLQSIIGNYKNLRVLMMDSNKGTYVTTNTIMKEAKYDGLIRFDSDDIMLPTMIQRIMEEKEDNDLVYFQFLNFGHNKTKGMSCGQVYMKHEIFDKFGGYMPFVCSSDFELKKRLIKFTKIKYIKEVLFKRRIHGKNLTVDEKTNMSSPLRNKINHEISIKVFKTEKDAIIDCEVNTFKEIFPDSDISCYKFEKLSDELDDYNIKTNKKQKPKNKKTYTTHLLA